jgi:threonine/homoserine/homoserine lactone efflux protein
MSADALLALLVYAFVMSITPGPNNFMLLASGVNFGFRRSVPHMLGISGGFLVLLFAVGMGLGALLIAVPGLHAALKLVGAAYLLHLAWRIAMSRSLAGGGAADSRPMTFLEAAAFQWVNPKAWLIAVGGMALYADAERPLQSILIVAVAFAAVMLPSISVWTGFGTALRGFLADPVRLKWFNVAMGLLLAATMWPMLR